MNYEEVACKNLQMIVDEGYVKYCSPTVATLICFSNSILLLR
jgi:hypothetical protein